jgi:hypothetical protein
MSEDRAISAAVWITVFGVGSVVAFSSARCPSGGWDHGETEQASGKENLNHFHQCTPIAARSRLEVEISVFDAPDDIRRHAAKNN